MKNIILILLFIPLSLFSQNEIALSIFDSALNKVKKDDINGALSDFDLALKKTNNDSIISEILYERAQLKRRGRYNIKDYYGALEDYTKAIEFNPNNVKAYVFRGILNLRNFKKPELHRSDILKSIEIDPFCGTCWTEIGFGRSSFSKEEQKNGLKNALKFGVDLDFDGNLDQNYYLYGPLADFAEEDGDINGSIDYRKLLIDNFQEIDSDGDGITDDIDYVELSYFGMAYTYFFKLDDFENALYNINKAIEINPNNVDFFTFRSKIKYSNNDLEGSLKDYKIAKSTTNQIFYNDVLFSEDYYPYKDFDRDLDSIAYKWAEPLDNFNTWNPPATPSPLAFENPYSFSSPLPGNPNLDVSTGEVAFNANIQGEFVTVIKVESWRCGQMISEVFREIQLIITNCSANDPPDVSILDMAGNPISYFDTVHVGDVVQFQLKGVDIGQDVV